VEGKLIAAAKAAETRHLRRIQRDYEQFDLTEIHGRFVWVSF
jgi:hypothetical protein